MTYLRKYQLLSKPYMHMSDLRQVLGVAYPKFKPLWDQMIKDLENQTGKKLGAWQWGIPTNLICDYFNIDINRYQELAANEKADA